MKLGDGAGAGGALAVHTWKLCGASLDVGRSRDLPPLKKHAPVASGRHRDVQRRCGGDRGGARERCSLIPTRGRTRQTSEAAGGGGSGAAFDIGSGSVNRRLATLTSTSPSRVEEVKLLYRKKNYCSKVTRRRD